MNGSDWLWMSLSMGIGIVTIGAVVVFAMRLASKGRERPS